MPHLALDKTSGAIEQEESWHAADSMTCCQLTSDGAPHTESKHLDSPRRALFEPVYDRLGQEAGASSVGVELDQGGMSVFQQAIDLRDRTNVAGPSAQCEKRPNQTAQNEKEQPVLTNTPGDLAYHERAPLDLL